MTKIVKLVVPSYGLRGEFSREELNEKQFSKLQREYIEEQMVVLEQVSAIPGIVKFSVESIRMLMDKLIPPFQYWLENRIACEHNAKGTTDEKKAKAREFAERIGTNRKEIIL